MLRVSTASLVFISAAFLEVSAADNWLDRRAFSLTNSSILSSADSSLRLNPASIPGTGVTSTLSSPFATASVVCENLAFERAIRRFSIPISKPIRLFIRCNKLALLLSDLVLTVTNKSLKYERLKS